MKTRLLLAVLLVAACKKPPVDGGIIAAVQIDPAARVTCVELVVSDMNGMLLTSKRFPLGDKKTLELGVSQAGDPALPDDVRVRAQGLWSVSGCTDPARPNAAPADQQVRFVAARIDRVDFTVRPPGATDDADQDGYTGATRGGPDCDDTQRTVSPGANEACGMPVDFNCNGRIGCDDPACTGMTCVRPAVSLAFTNPPLTTTATQCSQAIVVEARDDQGMPAPVSADTTVTLTEPGATLGLQFFEDSGCTLPATTRAIPRMMREVRFYARATRAGLTRLDASATGFGSAQQDFRINPGPAASIAFATAAQTVKSDACSAPVTIEARDMSGNAAPVAANVALTLTAMPAMGFSLFSDASCSSPLMMPSLQSGTPSLTFYFRPARAPGMVTLTASAGALGTAMQTETVVPGDPTRIVFVTPTQTVVAGACSTAMTLKLVDAQGTDTTATMPTSIGLSAPTMTFFTASNCSAGSAITAANIPAGAGNVTVYFSATGAGAPSVTASGGGLMQAAQVQTIVAAPPVRLAFATGPQGVQTTTCSGAVRLQTQDTFGNRSRVSAPLAIALSATPSTGFSFYAGMGCSGAAVTSVSIPANMDQAVFSYRGNVAGLVTMTADSALDPDPTQVTNVGVGPPAALAYLTGPQMRTANECSGAVTLEARDSGGNRSNVMTPLTINLAAAPSAGFTFYSDPTCTTQVTSVQMPANSAQVSFYFLGLTATMVTMTPTSTLPMGPGPQVATIRPAVASAIAFVNTARTITAGTCSQALTVQTRDAFLNVSPVTADLTLSLSGTPGTALTFHSDAACASAPTPNVTVSAGQSQATFYARGNLIPSYTLQAQGAAVGAATQPLSVTAAAASKLVILTAPQSLQTGVCSGALMFERRDQFDNPVTINQALNVALSGGAGISFFAAAGCGGAPIASTSIPANAATVTVYFRGTTPGMPSVTGTGTGLATPGTQQANISVSPPSVIAFTTAPQPMVVAGTVSAPVTVESRDAFGNPSPVEMTTTVTLNPMPVSMSFDYCGDAACVSVNPTVQLGAGASTTTFYFRGNVAQSFTLSASAPGLGVASQMHTVVPAAVSQLRITGGGGQTRNAGACSTAVTVQRQDAFGNPVSTGTTAVTLAANPAMGFTFYQGGGCTTPLGATLNITTGSTATFNFIGTVPGTVQVTASSGSLAPDTVNHNIAPIAPDRFVYTTSPLSVQATSPCEGPVTVEARDQFGNAAAVTSNVTVTPSTAAAANAVFYLDSGCTAPAASFLMPSGSTQATYYLTATRTSMSPYTLTTSGTGLTAATQSLTVQPGPAAQLGFVGSGQSIGVDRCSAMPLTVRVLDQFTNPTTVSVATTVTPAASPMAGGTFFSNSTCDMGSGGAFTLMPGDAQGTFHMRGGALASGSTVSVSVMSSPSLPLLAPQVQTITAGVASKLAITSAPPSLMAGECSGPITVQARDAADNNTTVASTTTVNLTAQLSGGGPATGFLFYADPSCTTSTVTTQILANQATGTFYVKGITGGTFDMMVGASGFTGGTQAATIAPAVRTGTCTIADTASSTTCAISPPLNANLSRTMMLFQVTTASNAGIATNAVRCVLTDTMTITCSRFGTTGAIAIRWHTVSRPAGLVVQHLNSIASNTAASQPVPVNAVANVASTFLLLSSQMDAAAAEYDDHKLTTARLTAANTVTLERLTTPDVAITYALQVVQWTGSTVERGTLPVQINNGSTSVAVTGLPDSLTNPVFLLHTNRWGTGAGNPTEMCHLAFRGALASTTSLSFSRTSGNNANACDDDGFVIEYERVTLPASTNRVEAYTVNTSAASTTQPVSLSDVTRSVVFFSGQGFGGGQSWGETADATQDRIRDVTARASFASPTSVAIERGSGSNTSATFTLFVWQLVP